MRPCSAAMSCSALAALAPTSAELRVSSAVASSSTLRSRTTCSLYSLSRLSISSSRVAQGGDVGAHLLALARGHARERRRSRRRSAASATRAPRRGDGGYFQVKSTRRSCAQLGSSVPFASSDPRGRTDSLRAVDAQAARGGRAPTARAARTAPGCTPACRAGRCGRSASTARPTFLRQSASRASAAVASVVSADSLKSKNTGVERALGGRRRRRLLLACRSRSTQSSFCAQSFSVLHGFFALQAPLTQCWPPGHSLSLAQALHWLAMHSWFAGQSALLRQ